MTTEPIQIQPLSCKSNVNAVNDLDLAIGQLRGVGALLSYIADADGEHLPDSGVRIDSIHEMFNYFAEQVDNAKRQIR